MTPLSISPRHSPPKKSAQRKPNMREQVYLHLRTLMQKGEIRFSDRLVDHEIAADLRVSRMPVREALLQLKNEGLLDSTSRGFVLRRFTPTDIAQLFEIRLLLEPPAAAAACEKATLEGLAIMRMAAEESEKAHNEGDILAYMKANTTFRSTWISLVPNPHLANMISRLVDHVEAVRLATLQDPKWRASSLLSTQKILDGFMKKDTELVQDSVRYNLRHAAAAYYAVQGSLMEESQ